MLQSFDRFRGPILLALASLSPACRETPSSSGGRDAATSDGARAARTPSDPMTWWRDARFGMFVHWGLYAIPAGEWPIGDPRAKKDHGEWIRDSARIPIEEYAKLQPRFDPVEFDADAWAQAAADAGMKYLVITSKHHDGFALYDSALTDWDVGGTPFRRDILAELSAACARRGVRFCTYHSIMDWHHPDYLPRRGWEEAARPAAGAEYARFEDYLHGQVREIVERYRPGVMWFDGEWESTWSHERGVRLFDLCRRLDPQMIVNNRVDVHRGGMGGFSDSSESVGDFATPEQEIPATGPVAPGGGAVDWETCMTMNDHWGFCAADANWKSTQDLVRKLVDIASKGGNFLLNVGPRADGTFPPEALARLSEIGAWMQTNGESIHGTTASPFDALDFGRCTVREGRGGDEPTRLYLHVFERPRGGRLVVPGLGNEVVRAYALAQPDRALLHARHESDVWVELPPDGSDAIDTVVVLEVAGRPIVYRAPTIEAAANAFVKPLLVRVSGVPDGLEARYTLDGTEPSSASPVYREPIRIEATTDVRARCFRGTAPVSASGRARYERATPRLPATVSNLVPGILAESFDGDWERVPDFGDLQPSWSSLLSRIDLQDVVRPSRGLEKLAVRFTATGLPIREDDVYTFQLTSDDGSKLWIDGELVIDNDGLHVAQTRNGSIALARGDHSFTVGWFNRSGEAVLDVKYGPLGHDLAPIRVRQ